MIEEKLAKIEDKIRQAPAMESENKELVLKLIDELKLEVEGLESVDSEKLASAGSFAEVGANEVTREDGSKGILDIALKGFNESVKDFEESHPKLVQIVNSICTQLANSGL
ncbi:MAG: DUF4404 family protein [Lentisphaeraceae bacterium]|nr:DUF4404 family protein [Lentisphaeraceae bacterium]